MLKTVWLTEKLNSLAISSGCVMLLGGFDGLHCGHQKLVERAKTYALPVGIMTIVGGKGREGLFTLAERERLFKEAGIDFVFEMEFSAIKNMSPETFAALLTREFPVQAFVCGDDFKFGKMAQGTPETLKQATRVRVEVVELVKINGVKISSCDIKNYLQALKVEEANALLGRRFFLVGSVQKDRQIGRTLGFPTANIEYPQGKFSLKAGVYETRVTIDGKEYKGITNYGARPTFDNDTVWTETYLDGFDGDLYGKTLTVEFVRFLRNVEKFDSADSLKKQLQTDIRRVREND